MKTSQFKDYSELPLFLNAETIAKVQMAVTLRPSTLEHYRKDLTNHVKPYLGAKLLTQVTATDLRKLYDALKRNGRVNRRPGQSHGLSSNTVHGIHTTLVLLVSVVCLCYNMGSVNPV